MDAPAWHRCPNPYNVLPAYGHYVYVAVLRWLGVARKELGRIGTWSLIFRICYWGTTRGFNIYQQTYSNTNKLSQVKHFFFCERFHFNFFEGTNTSLYKHGTSAPHLFLPNHIIVLWSKLHKTTHMWHVTLSITFEEFHKTTPLSNLTCYYAKVKVCKLR